MVGSTERADYCGAVDDNSVPGWQKLAAPMWAFLLLMTWRRSCAHPDWLDLSESIASNDSYLQSFN